MCCGRREVGLHQVTEGISASERGGLPLRLVLLPVFDLRVPPSYALAKSICCAGARHWESSVEWGVKRLPEGPRSASPGGSSALGSSPR